VRQAEQEQLALLVEMALPVKLEPPEPKALLEELVQLAPVEPLEQQEGLVQLEHLELLVEQELLERVE
jgi:hypothetical protein